MGSGSRRWRIQALLIALAFGLQLCSCRSRVGQSDRVVLQPDKLRLFQVESRAGGKLVLLAYEKKQLTVGQRFSVVDDSGTFAVVEITRVQYVECSHCENYAGVTRTIRAPSRSQKGEGVAVGPLRAPLRQARVVARDPNAFVRLICTTGRRRKPILTLDLDGDTKVDLRRVAAFCPDVCYEVQARRGTQWLTVQRDCLPVILDHKDRSHAPTPRRSTRRSTE